LNVCHVGLDKAALRRILLYQFKMFSLSFNIATLIGYTV